MTPLHIVLPFPLGDQVVFTGVVRELRRLVSAEQLPITLDVPVPEVWRHNPRVNLRRRVERGRVVEIDGQYTAGANVRGWHMAFGFAEVLGRIVGVPFRPRDIRGEIYLSLLERRRASPVAEATGEELPYWIICNGGKFDRTVKWWPDAHYQEVVRALRGKVQFVQVGGRRHYHPRLEGALDLRGWTDVRGLVRLMYRAEGVLCPITGLMHLAAAVPRAVEGMGDRPCVVVGGGIEPAHWSVYPGQTFHSTVGALECTGLGCWKSRVRSLGDGAQQDEPKARCVAVEDGFPKCMRLISAGEVVASIERYLASGQCRRLDRASWRVGQAAARSLRGVALDAESDQPMTLGMAMDRWLGAGGGVRKGRREIRKAGTHSRGVVTEALGLRGAIAAWVLLRLLRELGCALPVEVWVDASAGQALGKFGRRVRRLGGRIRGIGLGIGLGMGKGDGTGMEFGREAEWIRRSGFREVLWLGAGCYPDVDPSGLFEWGRYRETGGVLWPGPAGGPGTSKELWGVFGLEPDGGTESGEGLMLLDRSRVERALDLMGWCGERARLFRALKIEGGDFRRLAFRKAEVAHEVVPGVAMVRERAWERRTGPDLPTFCQRVGSAFEVREPRRWVSWFRHEWACQGFVDEFLGRERGSRSPAGGNREAADADAGVAVGVGSG